MANTTTEKKKTGVYTACVVGGGNGGKLSMNALVASERFKLVAAADINPQTCKELETKYPGIRTFTSHQEMFKACPTDVVCVSTWAPTHEPVTMDALKLPLKGILVEKPLGHTAASGERILKAIMARKLPMATPHNLLTKRAPLEVIERVHAGHIGKVKIVEIQNTRWDIINAGIHWLNYVVNILRNEPMDYVMAICEAGTRTYRDGMQVETTAVTYAQTASGVRIVMNTGDDVKISREGKKTLFRIVGEAGVIECWGWDDSYILLNAEYPSGKLITPTELTVMGHQRHLENMAAMIDNGQPDYSIPESSLKALELCEGAYVSSRHRCKVTFPVSSFVPPPAVQWDPGMPYSGNGGGRDGRKLG